MNRELDLEAFRVSTDAPALSAGRLWGVARPRLRHTREDAYRWVGDAAKKLPLWGVAAKPLSTRQLRAALRRVTRPLVLSSLDYEQLELRAFAKVTNFGLSGAVGPGRALPPSAYTTADWADALGERPLAMARPNDWRRDTVERAFEGGAFDDLPSEHKHRGPDDLGYQRAVAERIKEMTGRTVHRKSWKAAARWIDALFAFRRFEQPASAANAPRLRWDDVADRAAQDRAAQDRAAQDRAAQDRAADARETGSKP